MCEIFQFLLNTVIIVTSFVWDQHRVFVIAIVTGECAILILQKLRFGVYHCYYCLLIYDDYVIILYYILNCHKTFLFYKISTLFICGIFENIFFAADKGIHNIWLLIIKNKYSYQVSVIKPSDHWNTGLYQGSDDRCEGDRNYDLNRLASAISGNTIL